MKIFQLTTVTYGLKPSAQLAIRTLSHLADLDGHKYLPEVAIALMRNFYVDDYLQSFHHIEEALEVAHNLNKITQGSGFSLSKWCSNTPEFLQHVPQENRLVAPHALFEDNITIKTFGILWATYR